MRIDWFLSYRFSEVSFEYRYTNCEVYRRYRSSGGDSVQGRFRDVRTQVESELPKPFLQINKEKVILNSILFIINNCFTTQWLLQNTASTPNIYERILLKI